VTLSFTAMVALGILGVGVLAALIFRRALRAGPPALQADRGQVSEGIESVTTADPIMRIPRVLFYLGALTVTQASLRVGFGLTVSELFFIAAFGATVIAVLAGRPFALVPNGLLVGVGLFAIGGMISSVGAEDPGRSVFGAMQAVYVMLLWAWTGATVLRTRPQLVIALTLWTISAAFDGFSAITQVLGADALGGSLEGGRATGLTAHPNDLGGACAIALIPALMLATNRLPGQHATPVPAWRWIILALVAAGLALSGSVAAMLAAFIAIVVWLVSPAVRAPGRLAVITALAFTMLAVMLAGGRITSPGERVSKVTGGSGASSSGGSAEVRLKTMKRALPRIADNPFVGTGLDPAGGGVNILDTGRSTPYQVHGQPVAAWYEAGIFGFLGLTIVAFTLARNGWRAITAGTGADHVIGLAIFAAFIAFFIVALAAPLYFQQYGWFAAVMAVTWGARRDATADLFVAERSTQPMSAAIAPRPLPH
jgi:hypothetical protein